MSEARSGDRTRPRFPPRVEWIGWPLVVTAAAFALFASYATHRDLNTDEGWQLECASRILDGQLQHRDFESVYTAGRHYLFAGLLAITGKSFFAFRLLLCLLGAVNVGLVFAIGRRLMPVGLALGAAVLTALVPGPWHKFFFSLILLVGIYTIARWLETGRVRWLALTGLAGGIGTWFRQDNGLFVLVVALALIAVGAIARRGADRGRELRRGLAEVAWLLVPAAVVLLAGFAFFALKGAGWALLSQCFGVAVGENAPKGGVLLEVLRLTIGGLGPISSHVVALLPWIAVLLPMPVILRVGLRALRRHPLDRAEALRFCVALGCLLVAPQVFRRDVLLRFVQCGTLFYLLWFALGWQLIARVASRPWLRRGIALVALALPTALAAMVLFAPRSHRMTVEYTGTAAVRFQRRVPFEVRGTTFFFTARRANELKRLVQFIEDTTSPEDPLLVLGQPSGIYFLTGRRSPLPLIRPTDHAVKRFGRRSIERAIFDSECCYVIADRGFIRRGGRGWRRFIKRHCKLVGPVGKRYKVWEIIGQ